MAPPWSTWVATLHLAPSALRVVAVETPAAYGPDAPRTGRPQPDAAAPEPLWVPSEADVLFVPPLHADEIAELLIHHRLPSRMAGRIHKASGGNPRLALAVGRSLADARTPVHHAEALSLSGRARDLARQLLGAASPAVRGTILLAALALRPTASLVRRAGRRTAEADLAAAERAGLISLKEDGRSRSPPVCCPPRWCTTPAGPSAATVTRRSPGSWTIPLRPQVTRRRPRRSPTSCWPRRSRPPRAGASRWLALATETPSRTTEPAPARGGAPSSLTDAELRLALLVRQGASNQEAAAKLYLSLKTVEARLTRIYQKLDVRSRAQLATAVNAWPGHRPTG